MTDTPPAAGSDQEPPPPPPRSPERVGLNTRILVRHDDALRRYQKATGAKRQAVVDQALQEYLARRGLLDDGGE